MDNDELMQLVSDLQQQLIAALERIEDLEKEVFPQEENLPEWFVQQLETRH